MQAMNYAFGGLGSVPFPPDVQEHLAGLDARSDDGTTLHPEARDSALNLSGISLSFGGVVALTDIDISVSKGEIRAIIGRMVPERVR